LLQRIGAVVERPDLYGYLSGWDNIHLFASLSKKDVSKKHLHEVLDLVGLIGHEKKKVKAYSQGMKQRLGIAIALAHDPELLILDEPTNGLDPQGIAEMRALIIHLSQERGKTVLVSSHLLAEIEQTATRMIIIHRGKKMVEGRVDDLLAPAETVTDIVLEMPDEILQEKIRTSEWGAVVDSVEGSKTSFKMHPSRVPELANWLIASGARIRQIRSAHSLETYFLSLTDDSAAAHRTV
jgi:ABC-2 type transport system ATP-binding protein